MDFSDLDTYQPQNDDEERGVIVGARTVVAMILQLIEEDQVEIYDQFTGKSEGVKWLDVTDYPERLESFIERLPEVIRMFKERT